MRVAFTGHRPPKAGLTYSHNDVGDRFAVSTVQRWLFQSEYAPISRAFVGGALGFDWLATRACFIEGVPYTLCLPFPDHDARWPDASRKAFETLRKHADDVVTVCDGPFSPGKMQIRNEYMVDHADVVAAWYDGSPGGTRNCVEYANAHDVPVVELLAYAHEPDPCDFCEGRGGWTSPADNMDVEVCPTCKGKGHK